MYTRMYDCVFMKIDNSDFEVGEIEWNGEV